ncbi:MAG: GNAT family N-acetyltransferase [Burkholderiaceae bacterium]|nr:GNAT family N-acetyltransferase [Burkholderiaceae bacterium]
MGYAIKAFMMSNANMPIRESVDIRSLDASVTYVLAKEIAPTTPEDLADWHRLVADGGGHERAYQSPAYASFRADVANSAAQVYTLRRKDSGKLQGIISFGIGKKVLAIGAGGINLMRREITTLVIYGSEPAAAVPAQEKAALYHWLLELNPTVDAIYLNVFPISEQGPCHQSTIRRAGLGLLMERGIEGCHTLDLASGFAGYEARISSKKRYNIRRQLRQLEQHAGEVTMHCLQDEADIPLLREAIKALGAHVVTKDSTFRSLARHRLMLVCLLRAGGKPVGLMLGQHGHGVWHVSNIFIDADLPPSFSVGTSLLHLALEQVSARYAVTKVDFGFGAPRHAFSSTQVQERRARVLLYRASLANRIFFGAYHVGNATVRKLLPTLKTMMARVRQRGT